MHKLHIANAFFEWELETNPQMGLQEAFRQHAIYRQLQFLPFLYAHKNDSILLSDTPHRDYLSLLHDKQMGVVPFFSLDHKTFSSDLEIESWGPSQLIAAWADEHRMPYRIPDWNVVKEVNSKHFSFLHSPKLPHATLLQEEIHAKDWLRSFEGRKVLKTCYGVSGKGHFLIEDTTSEHNQILSFLIREWKKGLPVIAEPWVDRVLDFSTQWMIDANKNIHYLGATLCENDARGQYRCNRVGKEEALFGEHLSFLQVHCDVVKPTLRTMAERGFFGNVGIDAMLYTLPENRETIHLHPIVEINARKTMGWAALQFQRHYFPNNTVRFSFTPGQIGYLPEFVEPKLGKRVRFLRNLTIH